MLNNGVSNVKPFNISMVKQNDGSVEIFKTKENSIGDSISGSSSIQEILSDKDNIFYTPPSKKDGSGGGIYNISINFKV